MPYGQECHDFKQDVVARSKHVAAINAEESTLASEHQARLRIELRCHLGLVQVCEVCSDGNDKV